MYGTITYGSVVFTGDPIEAIVSRLAVEVIGSNDDYSATLTRLTVESLGANDSINAEVTRLAVEVIYDSFTGVDLDVSIQSTRLTAEVIGSASEFAGKRIDLRRHTLEVIGSEAEARRGLKLPGVEVTETTVAAVLARSGFGMDDQMTLVDAEGRGLTLIGGTDITVSWSDGANSASTTFPDPGGPFLLSFRTTGAPGTAQFRVNRNDVTTTSSGSSWQEVSLSSINEVRSPATPHAGQIAELMVLARDVTTPELCLLEGYLQCKWLIPGCDVNDGEFGCP